MSLILAEAFPALYTWTFGRLSGHQIAGLLRAMYDAGTLGIATTRLAERNTIVIGIVILHVGEPIGKGTLRAFWRVARSQLGFWKGLRAFVGGVFANAMIHKRIPKSRDLVYIEALAVDTAERGQGVGTQLLTDAEDWARAQGRRRMALHVLQSNTGARRLYERAGYRLHQPEPRPAPPGSRRQGWVSLLMLRELEALSVER